ncbi:lymphocyte cytosolic protein 2 [Eucyclogobius newberryi]|uniref:lymphocyte cytosolic protein 2 n=1 Tax=Eucyclogobius newberryi TaxID=166745 RepID=UPI003B5A1F69
MGRPKAEAALTQAGKDGAFVVRDSAKGRAEHPYTLMVLKEAKIYNIKIRKQGQLFFLGSGLHNNTSFPGVREMITHHAHIPLLLIDAKDCSSGMQRPQCCLLHPAKAQQ